MLTESELFTILLRITILTAVLLLQQDVYKRQAKEQNLSLNPTKISGVCGRLMCCLKNEQDTYEELNSQLPNVGDSVTTPDKLVGEVSSVNVLRQRVKVLVTHDNDEKELKDCLLYTSLLMTECYVKNSAMTLMH